MFNVFTFLHCSKSTVCSLNKCFCCKVNSTINENLKIVLFHCVLALNVACVNDPLELSFCWVFETFGVEEKTITRV